jgi:phage/plasmid-like protein (TIGR03299 family)
MRLDFNETLGVVGKGYGIVQNTHAFDFIDILTTGELGGEVPTIESAGVLGNGERIFICAKFPEPIRLLGNANDVVNSYIVFTTSHDGSGAVTALCTNVRVVCQNTLNLAFQHNSGKISFKHTTNVMNRIDLTNKDNAEMAYRTLGLYKVYKEQFEQQIAALAKVKLTDKQMEEVLVKSVLAPDAYKLYQKTNSLSSDDFGTRSRNIITNILDANFTGVGQEIIAEKNTGFSLVNAVTTYYQNNFKWKNDEKKFDAIIGGSVQDKLQRTFNNVMLLAA